MDDMIKRLISQVSGSLDAYLSRNIGSQSYTEILDGNDGGGYGATRLYLSNQPVVSVASLTIDGTVIPASPDGIQAGYWIVDGMMLELISYWFTPGKGNVKVTYTAGFAVIPPALENVAMEIVGQRLKERGRIGITSESDGRGMNRSYKDEMPAWCKTILNQFANVVPA
jgi:hypothetical protein